MFRWLTLLIALVGLSALGCPDALAQGQPAREVSDDTREAAVVLGREGVALHGARRYKEALARLTSAEKLVHSPVFVLHIARCEQRLGQLHRAAISYQRVVDEPLTDDSPKVWRKAVADAREEIVTLRASIPRLLIQVRGGGPYRVTLNGVELDQTKLASAISVDPGKHHIVVGRDGSQSVERTVAVKAGDGTSVVHFYLPPAPPPLDQPAGPPLDEPDQQPSKRPNGSSHGLYVSGAMSLALGGVGLLVGAISGLIAMSSYDDLLAECPDPPDCRGAARGDYETVDTLAYVSTWSLVIGGVVTATGIVLVSVAGSADANDAGAEVSLSPFGTTLRVRF